MHERRELLAPDQVVAPACDGSPQRLAPILAWEATCIGIPGAEGEEEKEAKRKS
jgi:hypothetical protein